MFLCVPAWVTPRCKLSLDALKCVGLDQLSLSSDVLSHLLHPLCWLNLAKLDRYVASCAMHTSQERYNLLYQKSTLFSGIICKLLGYLCTSIRGSDLSSCYLVLFPQRLCCRKHFLSPRPALREPITKQDSSNQMMLVSFSISQLHFPKAFQLTPLLFFLFFSCHESSRGQTRRKKSDLASRSPQAQFLFSFKLQLNFSAG